MEAQGYFQVTEGVSHRVEGNVDCVFSVAQLNKVEVKSDPFIVKRNF